MKADPTVRSDEASATTLLPVPAPVPVTTTALARRPEEGTGALTRSWERPLSPAERAVWLLDQAAPLNGVIVAQLRGRAPTVEELRVALARLQARHPLLRARVDGQVAARPRFVVGEGVPEASIRRALRQGAESWRAEAEAEINTPFAPEGGPLLRAVLVAGSGAD